MANARVNRAAPKSLSGAASNTGRARSSARNAPGTSPCSSSTWPILLFARACQCGSPSSVARASHSWQRDPAVALSPWPMSSRVYA